MTIIALQFTAELVKVIEFRAADDFEVQGRFLFEKLTCEKCEMNTDDYIYVVPSQSFSVQYKDEDIEVHAFSNCRFCGNLWFVQMRRDLGDNYTALNAELSRAGQYATIMHFNIEGMMPEECSFVGKFVATTEVDNENIDDIRFARGLSYIGGEDSGAAIYNPKTGFVIVET